MVSGMKKLLPLTLTALTTMLVAGCKDNKPVPQYTGPQEQLSKEDAQKQKEATLQQMQKDAAEAAKRFGH